MSDERNDTTMDTTLGELIEAVSEVAFEYSDNPGEAYLLARLALVEILQNAVSVRAPGALSTATAKARKKEYLH